MSRVCSGVEPRLYVKPVTPARFRDKRRQMHAVIALLFPDTSLATASAAVLQLPCP